LPHFQGGVPEAVNQAGDPAGRLQIVAALSNAGTIYAALTNHGNDHSLCNDQIRLGGANAHTIIEILSAGIEIVLLLIGGDKRTQDRDIRAAQKLAQDW